MTDHIAAITEKCEQYWNAHGICDAEVHAMLEYIHVHARRVAAERDTLREWAREAQYLLSEVAQVDLPIESGKFFQAARLLHTYPPDADEEVTP